MLFDKFNNKSTITGVLTAIDPIHIGSAGAEVLDPTQVDNSVLKDLNGLPVIPGSSIKGVVRSYFEAVMRSVGKNACDCMDSKNKCVTDNDMKSFRGSEIDKAQQAYNQSCDVCKLFGGTALASKLQFKDSTYIGDVCVYEHRDGVGIERETGAAKRGAKYDFEIVPKGSKFTFTLIAENLDDEQKKYLDFILKTLENGELSVGGKTTRGLGRIQLSDVNRDDVDVSKLKEMLRL